MTRQESGRVRAFCGKAGNQLLCIFLIYVEECDLGALQSEMLHDGSANSS